ncbi:DUF3027 domain-containing protein [Mycetocola sp. 2940]|uniref:DUF3027 domain-containing protein n=1 Tax=Mycetocola sp. 2940 TaxID=3156452 RepID=UPI0033967162
MTTTENSTIEPTEAPPTSDAIAPEAAVAPEQDAASTPGLATEPAHEAGTRSDAAADPFTLSLPADAAVDPAVDSAVLSEQGAEIQPTLDEPVAERPAPVADQVLLASVDVARAALLEVTPADTIGEPVGHVAEEDHVLSLFFDSKLRGYPGWRWTVTLSRVGDDETPSVLETELMPGENALLAPEWVPWSERLADYQAGQEVAENEARALAEAAAVLDDSDDDDEDDVFSILHAGDVDGVDVDEIDEDASDDESDEEEDEEEDDDEEDDEDEDDDESEDEDADEDDSNDDSDDDSDDDDADDEDSDDDGPERSY